MAFPLKMDLEATFARIKRDLKFLQALFPETHKTFKIISANADGLEFCFVNASSENEIRITATTETQIMWFTENDDDTISSILENLSQHFHLDICNQISYLLKKLYYAEVLSDDLAEELEKLAHYMRRKLLFSETFEDELDKTSKQVNGKTTKVQVDVAQFLVVLAKHACHSERRNLIFNPFPDIHCIYPDGSLQELSSSNKDFDRCARALKELECLAPNATSAMLEKIERIRRGDYKRLNISEEEDRLIFPLLKWLISSNPCHIVKLLQKNQISAMVTTNQFLVLGSPDKEKIFQERKKLHGSMFLFHGSRIENWHSILHHGLLNASGTEFQLNGARNGPGVYLTAHLEIATTYSCKINTLLECLAVCEVVPGDSLSEKKGGTFVQTNAADVCIRFLVSYNAGLIIKMNSLDTHEVFREAVDAQFQHEGIQL